MKLPRAAAQGWREGGGGLDPPLPIVTRQQLEFLQQVVAPALALKPEFSVPVSITIAQAIIESATERGWGTSRLFTIVNNPFGIKYAHRQGAEDYAQFDAQTWEVGNGHKVEEIAQFQRFPSLKEAFRAHATLLESPHYAAAREALKIADPKLQISEYANRLGPQGCGYSTNPQYGELLMELIREYRLDDPRALAWYAVGKDPQDALATQAKAKQEAAA